LTRMRVEARSTQPDTGHKDMDSPVAIRVGQGAETLAAHTGSPACLPISRRASTFGGGR
jgi:hypothetical protein